LVGRQEGHPACKTPWRGCGGGGTVSPVGVVPTWTIVASASINLPCSIKIQRSCFFWYWPTRVFPDYRPLNGCCCCCVIQSVYHQQLTVVPFSLDEIMMLFTCIMHSANETEVCVGLGMIISKEFVD